jgi:hypothetical protein
MRRVAQQFIILSLWLLILMSAKLHAGANQAKAKTDSPPAQLEQNVLPAAESHKTLLNVARFGRYSLLAVSKQGTALQLIDRMAGPGEIEGKAGEQDGRLDAFLERGQYQVVTYGHKRASGTVRIDLHPFTELNLPQPPQLIDFKLVEGQLHDFEQLSYWLDIKQRQFVILEAAGRSLSDLRLWKDGNWLMEAQPAMQIIHPKEGQPLLTCRLNVELDPGLYLLTAYGGPSQSWAEESKSHPFYLREGIPRLGMAGRRRFVTSPFGTDRYLVPGSANYFRMELPEARAAKLQVDWFDASRSFDLSESVSEISKKSVPPVAELHTAGGNDRDHVITINAEAGQPYVLQQFEIKYVYSFEGNKEYWISTIHSGFTADSVDATAIVTSRQSMPPSRDELFREQTIEIGSKEYWHRRINVLDRTTLFMHIKDAGSYQLICQGIEAQYQVEPFTVNRPKDYKTPQPKPCGANWDLDAGYYILTVTPTTKGVADLLMRPADLLDIILNTIGWGKSVPITPSREATRFSQIPLAQNRTYTIHLNRQPEVKAGVILRALPMDLADPLYVVQEPAETVTIPFQLKEPGTLRAEAEDGSLLEMSLDGSPWQTAISADIAAHTVAVRHSLKNAALYTLAAIPKRLDAQTPLPSISPQALAALPKFPIIDENTSPFGNLQKRQSKTYLLKADKAALYQLQSTGLLATAGNLRSRTNPSFVRKSQNGVGRNFNLQQYLREGDYQMTVTTEEESAGHFGLQLIRTAVRNAGFLTSKIPARTTLEPGQAVAYYFQITTPGEFRVRALGEGRTFHCRLEDKDGWPVIPPNIEADISRYFAAGQYRLVILPEVTTARVVAQIEPTPRQRSFKGHGPHLLKLAEKIDHVWMEPEGEQPRTPDQWEFIVPAPIEAFIDLSNEMQGNLLRMDDSGNGIQIDKVMPSRTFKAKLDAGRYRLETVAIRRNNRAPYRVAIMPAELVVGLSRDVQAPISIPLSVGKTGLVEINSFGSDDVQARLFDNQGHLMSFNDDRPDDWNFLIAQVLPPGRYRLDVSPSGKARASTTISMLTPEEEQQPVLTLPAQLKPALKAAVQIYPLPLISNPIMLMASVDSNENVGLAIESLQDGTWQVLAGCSDKSPRIFIPLGGANSISKVEHRLRVWSLDRREMKISLHVESIIPQTVSETQLQLGISIAPSTNPDSAARAFLVKLDHPGIFQVEENSAGFCWSASVREPCQQAQNKLAIAWKDELWAAAVAPPASAASRPLRARRLMLSSATAHPLQFPMRDQGRAFCDLNPNGNNPILLLATTQEGQPAIQLEDREARRPSSLKNIAIASRGSASVLFDARAPAAAVWAADPECAGLDVRLHPYYFPSVQLFPSTNTIDGKLDGIAASGFSLAAEPKRFHITLGNATVAVLSKGNEIVSVHWQGGAPFATTVDSIADRLTLLHTRQEEDRFAIEVIPLRSEELIPPLSIGSLYEQIHLRSGVERLTVIASPEAAAKPVALHVRGSAESVTFVGDNGQVLRGSDFMVPAGGGTLEITHGAGLVLSWLDQAGNEGQGLWPFTPKLDKVEQIALPATRKMQAGAEAFQINADAPLLLHVRMAAPSISLLKRASEEPEVAVHQDQTLMEAYLPPGTAQLYLRSIGGGTPSAAIEFTASPVTPIGEGLGSEVLLTPGDSRLFSFEVKQAGPVGIGVRASSDVIESELFSSSGKSLGKGTVQKFDLKPGTYLLAIRAPKEGSPIRARPAVVGIVLPSTGPPEDEIRKYLEPAESRPRFTSRRRDKPIEPEHFERAPEQEGADGDRGPMEMEEEKEER